MPKIEFYDLIRDRVKEYVDNAPDRGMNMTQLYSFGESKLPTRGSGHAAGLDLYASERVTLAPWDTTIVPTGLAINKMPEGTYGRIAPRSGLAVKGVFINAGVVDADYRGELKVVAFNSTREGIVINKGDRIAQLVLEKIVYADPEWVYELETTERGEGGLGSTGR